MKPSKYVGYAGQLDVMAELSMRGYNVAAPGVDIGDDVLVLNEDTGKIDRVQVKTARQHTKSSSNKKNRLIYEFLVHKPRITEIYLRLDLIRILFLLCYQSVGLNIGYL